MTGHLYFLLLHLSAFALFTGTLVTDILLHKQLWSYWQTDAPVSKVLYATSVRYTRLMGIALGIALVAGILLMSQLHRVYGPQLWIRIKIGLVVVLLVCRVLTGLHARRIREKIFNGAELSYASLKNRTIAFQWIQVTLVLVIIVLSVFKFN